MQESEKYENSQRSIVTIQHLVLKSKKMQHISGGIVQYWHRTKFQILVNLPKWYMQVFFGDYGGRNLNHPDLGN